MSHNVRLPKKVKDLTGQRFGSLTVKSYTHTDRSAYWSVTCDCGKTNIVRGSALTTGKAKSCGCLKLTASKTHGFAGSSTYISWNNMMQRCYNTNRDDFNYYGGRGITVCERWHDFANFLADMDEKPYATSSIERKDNNGSYEPGNCVWSSKATQNRNKRSNVFVNVQGKRLCLADACKLRKVSPPTVYNRMRRGMTMQQAIDAPDGRL